MRKTIFTSVAICGILFFLFFCAHIDFPHTVPGLYSETVRCIAEFNAF
jgi:hypothetical protein